MAPPLLPRLLKIFLRETTELKKTLYKLNNRRITVSYADYRVFKWLVNRETEERILRFIETGYRWALAEIGYRLETGQNPNDLLIAVTHSTLSSQIRLSCKTAVRQHKDKYQTYLHKQIEVNIMFNM